MPRPGTTNQRGYGTHHRRTRATWRPIVEAGGATCSRCSQPIAPGEEWDLGHVPGSSRQLYAGPQHARCNRDTTDERQGADPDPRPRTRW